MAVNYWSNIGEKTWAGEKICWRSEANERWVWSRDLGIGYKLLEEGHAGSWQVWRSEKILGNRE